jgi:hypothetical protein
VPGPHEHEQGSHTHGGHSHAGHTHEHEHEGKRARAAKDRAGRHDEEYYGQRTGLSGGPRDVPSAPREVGSGQGTRSFRGGGARRRPV